MIDEQFEWDDAKAAANARSHGVTFEMARDVFQDTSAIEWTDTQHGDTEERFILIGMADSQILFIVYAMRRDRIRIIAARAAEPRERRRYHNANET